MPKYKDSPEVRAARKEREEKLGIRESNRHALKALFSASSGIFLLAIRVVLTRRRNTRLCEN